MKRSASPTISKAIMQKVRNLPSVGLSADPVTKSFTVTNNVKPTILPYKGIHVTDTDAKRPYPTDELRFKHLTERELGSAAERPPEFTDPCELLINRIEQLSRTYGCTEQQAEKLLFSTAI